MNLTYQSMFTKRRPAVKKARVASPVRPPPFPLLTVTDDLAGHLAPCQRAALEHIATRRPGAAVFVTGRAGCGKSEVISVLRTGLAASGARVLATAASGIAADALGAGATTLHSALGLIPGMAREACVARVKRNKTRVAVLAAAAVLIVDEVSMISGETLEDALAVLAAARKGAPLPVLVFVGDFLQLPAVDGTPLLRAPVWARLAPVVFNFTTSYRQADDPAFVTMLDELRVGVVSDATHAALTARVGLLPAGPSTELYPRRRDVAAVNDAQLRALPDPPVVFVGQVTWSGAPADVSPDPPAGITPGPALAACNVALPPDVAVWQEADRVTRNSLKAPVLALAPGASVMFCANTTQEDGRRIHNGAQGVVTGFRDGVGPLVRLAASGRVIAVAPHDTVVRLSPGAEEPTLIYRQLPLQLAWALTVHKAQGQSLDSAVLDLGPSNFETAQVYVALSRVRRLDSVFLRAWSRACVKADPDAVAFYAAL